MNLGLSKVNATSWILKSTSATTLTMRNNMGKLPSDVPLQPLLMKYIFIKIGDYKEQEKLA